MPPKSKSHKQLFANLSRIFQACQLFFWGGYTIVYNSWMADKPIVGIDELTKLIDSFSGVYVNENGYDFNDIRFVHIYIYHKYPSRHSYSFMVEFANKLAEVLGNKVEHVIVALEWFGGTILLDPPPDPHVCLKILTNEIKKAVDELTNAHDVFR